MLVEVKPGLVHDPSFGRVCRHVVEEKWESLPLYLLPIQDHGTSPLRIRQLLFLPRFFCLDNALRGLSGLLDRVTMGAGLDVLLSRRGRLSRLVILLATLQVLQELGAHVEYRGSRIRSTNFHSICENLLIVLQCVVRNTDCLALIQLGSALG